MTIVANDSITVSNVNDGTITHTAYAYSADGSDRFTTVYPKLNLLNGTKVNDIFKGTGTANAGGTQRYTLDKSLKISDLKLSNYQELIFEFDWKATGTNPSGTFVYQTQTYYKGTGVTVSPTNTSGHVKNTFYNLPVTTDISTFINIRQDNIPTTVTVEIYNVMMYIVDYSPWMPSASEVTTADYPSYMGQYSDFVQNGSSDPSKYIWSKIRGSDGNNSYLHTAYSWSSDGSDRFTTVYPNLNLLTNSLLTVPLVTTVSSTATLYGNPASVVNGVFTPTTYGNTDLTISANYISTLMLTNGTYSASLNIKNNSANVASFQFIFIAGNYVADTTKPAYVNGTSVPWDITAGNPRVALSIPANANDRYTLTFTSKNLVNNVGPFIIFRDTTSTPTLSFSKPKFEAGMPTPWMPSQSEVKPIDYPTFRGEYSDNEIESSSDYKKYSWTVYKGEDSRNYKAWSWSSDGSDRFTTVYPNLNLLVNSSAKTKDGFFKNFDKVENDYGEVTIKGTNTWVSKNLWGGFSINPRDYKPNDKYTMSMDVMFTSWNLPVGTTITEFWIGQRYSKSTDGSISSYKQICSIDLPRDPSDMLNQWIRITKTSTIPPYADPAVLTEALFMTKFTGASEGSFTVRVRKPKQEPGEIVTPWTPSESEYQDDWSNAVPKYIGYGGKNSQNPNDYDWEIGSGYTDAKTIVQQTQVTQLTQDLSGFKTTVSSTYLTTSNASNLYPTKDAVSGTYLNKTDATNLYPTKSTVTSQINQKATDITSSVQSWTNDKLTGYSTIQQTNNSIASAVADKADKSQITQLSNKITSKVSVGDVTSQINQEAGKILIQADKLVLSANTTVVEGDAFIRGDMIVDGTIKAKQLDVEKISSVSSKIGTIENDFTLADGRTGTLHIGDSEYRIDSQILQYDYLFKDNIFFNPEGLSFSFDGDTASNSGYGNYRKSGSDFYIQSLQSRASYNVSGISLSNESAGYRIRIDDNHKMGFVSENGQGFEFTGGGLSVNGGYVKSSLFKNVKVNIQESYTDTGWFGVNAKILKCYGVIQNRRHFNVEIDLKAPSLPNPDMLYRGKIANIVVGSLGEGSGNREFMIIIGVNDSIDNVMCRVYWRDGGNNWSELSKNDSTYLYKMEVISY